MRWRARREVTCPQCAAPTPAGARWCGACGASLRTPATASDAVGGGQDATARDATGGRGARLAAAGVLVALLGGLLLVRTTAPEPVVQAGHTARGDGARTGIVSTTTVPAPDGVAWRSEVDLPALVTAGADVLGTTSVDGRELLVVLDPAVAGHRVTSHDVATGEVVATTMLPLGNQPFDTSLADGLVAHRDLGTVTLVDVATGEHRWTVERRLREDTTATPFGVVGVDAEDARLAVVLLDLEDGSEAWRHVPTAGGRVTSILATDDVVVVAGQQDGEPFLLGLEPADGSQRWSLSGGAVLPPAEGPLPPPVTDGEHLLLVGGRRVVVVDPTDGAVTEVALPDGLFAATGDLDEGRAVISDGGRQLAGLELVGGGARVGWRATLGQPPVIAVDVAGDVTALRTDGGTSLLDTATGDTTARVAPGAGSSRLALTDTGAVARVTRDGHVELVGVGGVVWRAPTVAVHLPDLVTDAGAVAVATPQGVQVHDVVDGRRRFAHEAFIPGLVDAAGLTAPALLGGRVAIAPPAGQPPDRGGLLALFADSGIVDWARDGDRVVPRGTPVVDRDVLVLPVGSQLLGYDRRNGARTLVVETSIARADVAAADGWLVAVDGPRDRGDLWVGRRGSGDLVYRAPIRTCGPPVLHDGLVIVGTHVGDVIARDLETGEQPWGERTSGSSCRALSIAGDHLVVLVDDRELHAIGLDDGEAGWRVRLPAVAAGAPVVAGDQVLVPTLAGEVVAYEVGADEPAWRVDVGGVPAGSVAVDSDTVLVLTRAGELVALR